ncbi:MAG: Tex family protein [Balneolaceae bacterium]
MTEQQILETLARDTGAGFNQVKQAAALFDKGATIPFIARYRQEATGGLDEQQLRKLKEDLEFHRTLQQRKEFILDTVENQGNLTEDLQKAILGSGNFTVLEDLYLPYKTKRQTRAAKATDKGLEPLADLVWEQKISTGTPRAIAAGYVDREKGVDSAEEALAGACDIVAERVSQQLNVRDMLRRQLRRHGTLACKAAGKKAREKDQKGLFETYYDFSNKVKYVKPHQVLAIDRGEREGILRVNVEVPEKRTLAGIDNIIITNNRCIFAAMLKGVTKDAWKRLLRPSLERELRSRLTDEAGDSAIETFAENVRNLLLQPPLDSKVVIGIDPAYRTGCKVAVVSETGTFLESVTIYPTPPHNNVKEAKKILSKLVKTYSADLIAIGNGTGSRETEQVVADLLGELKEKQGSLDLSYLIVSEAGASVYSASDLAREEFPDLDASRRGTISIARRVQDPLAELVKIDPKSVGVGLYQHDVNQGKLNSKLDEVVESCVNHVGVNLNSASAALLNYVSGLGKTTAEDIIRYRSTKGRFYSRKQLLEVDGVGPFRFEQAAGFLRIPDSSNPFDNTAIHPESYETASQLCEILGIDPSGLSGRNGELPEKLQDVDVKKLAGKMGTGQPTLELIIENLLKPGRDPREDMPEPVLRQDVLNMEDLSEGITLKGTVRNVVDFGAFVDIGVKTDGLLHVSQIRPDGKRVKNVMDEVSVGDVIDVKVISIDIKRQRIGLKRIK